MLSASTLKNELLKIYDPNNPNFVGWPTTSIEGATNFVNAFATYASQVQDSIAQQSMLPGIPEAAKAAMLGIMITIPPAGLIPASLLIMDTAIMTYWMTATFVPVPPVTLSKVTVVIPGGWVSGLTPLLLDQAMPLDTKCQLMASVIDTVSKASAVVTLTTPLGPILGTIL